MKRPPRFLPRFAKRWWWARVEGRKTLVVTIANVTEPQREAIESLFQQWQALGGMGASRWTCLYADGDGNFRPRITVNGKRPKFSSRLKSEEAWKGGELRIDFDTIAWRMRDE